MGVEVDLKTCIVD